MTSPTTTTAPTGTSPAARLARASASATRMSSSAFTAPRGFASRLRRTGMPRSAPAAACHHLRACRLSDGGQEHRYKHHTDPLGEPHAVLPFLVRRSELVWCALEDSNLWPSDS